MQEISPEFNAFDLFLISPLIALFTVSLIPIAFKVFRGNREPSSMAVTLYAMIGFAGAAGLAFATQNASSFAFSKALVVDGVSIWSTLLIAFVGTLSVMMAKENSATNGKQFSEHTFLLMNSAVGMLILAWSNDLIVTFIGLEVMSLCLYILVAMSNEERLSKEAAFKYFVLGSFASAIYLYGAAFVFGSAGTTYLDNLARVAPQLIETNNLFLFGVVMVFIGLLFKVAIFPFHAWTPDVYQGAPTPVTGFMAAGVKIVTFMALLRWVETEALLGEGSDSIVTVLEWLAVLTMLAGNIAAIMQDNLKRMLAYSGIAHSGYAMVGLIAAGVGGESLLGASSLLFYVFAYSIMTLGGFAFVSLFEKTENSLITVTDIRGLAAQRPALALSLTVLLLSLAGIPPTIGFFGKFFLFSAAVKQGFFWLALWGVINSVISVYYYLRPVVLMYMEKGEETQELVHRPMTSWMLGATAVLVILTGIFASPFYEYVLRAVQ